MILLENYIAEEVPNRTHSFNVFDGALYYRLLVHSNTTQTVGQNKKLPEGNWRFLFTTEGVTEEQAAWVVDENICDDVSICPSHKKGEPCCGAGEWYNYVSGVEGEPFHTPTESFNSLLQSRGLSLDKNYAILEKITT